MTDPEDRQKTEARLWAAIQEANSLDDMGQTGLAVKVLMPLFQEFPSEPSINIYLALYLRRAGRFDEAVERGRSAVQSVPQSSFASLVLFQALWDSGNRNNAIEEIRRFVAVRRSRKHTIHYDEILSRWDAGDRDAADHIRVTLDEE